MMLSMTAYAYQEAEDQFGQLSCEIRSVNHRYQDIAIRLPEKFRNLEYPCRELIKQKVSRGKIDCQFRFEENPDQTDTLTINQPLVLQILAACREIDSHLGAPSAVKSIDILSYPGVINITPQDYRDYPQHILALLNKTLDEFIATRAREGSKIQSCISERIEAIQQEISTVKTDIPKIHQQLKLKFLERIKDMQLNFDEQRLEQELLIQANKSDVSEEVDRLTIHCAEVRRILAAGGLIGRRLDFIMQELNREANTLASKACDNAITQASVTIKVLIEQMREQIQNIE